MIHFRNKNDILRWLAKNCPRKAIVRSLDNAELLGGFNPIPPSSRAGWIVRVTSVYGRVWIVAVIPCVGKPDYEIRVLSKVPWKNYIGCHDSSCVYGGDRPYLYRSLKEKA